MTADETLFCFFYFLPFGLEDVAVFAAAKPFPEIPTAYETALLVTCVRVFFTNPMGFLKVILALDLPSSEMLKESIALVLMFSIMGPPPPPLTLPPF